MNIRTKVHIPILKLEALLSGDLKLSNEPEIKQHIETCEQCAAYLKNAPAKADLFLKQFPTFESLDKASRPQQEMERGKLISAIQDFFAFLFSPRPALVIVTLVVLVTGTIFFQQHLVDTSDLSVKGEAKVRLWVNGGSVESHEAAIPVLPGDTLQLGIVSAAPYYYQVLFIDDNKPIERYMPKNDSGMSALGSTMCDLLPSSIVLNSGWQNETIYIVLSKTFISFTDAKIFVQLFLNDKPLKSGNEIHVFTLQNKEGSVIVN